MTPEEQGPGLSSGLHTHTHEHTHPHILTHTCMHTHTWNGWDTHFLLASSLSHGQGPKAFSGWALVLDVLFFNSTQTWTYLRRGNLN